MSDARLPASVPEDDARLTDFVDVQTDENSDEATTVPAEATPPESAEATPPEPAEATSPEPAEATSRWVPDGAVCAGCETMAERLWLDGDVFVCSACKDW